MRFACAAAGLLFACAPARVVAPSDPLAERARALRGLSLAAPIDVIAEDAASLLARERRYADESGLWSPGLAMFGLTETRVDYARIEGTGHLLGWYNLDKRRIHLDFDLPAARRERVLAHEVVHALQHHHRLIDREKFEKDRSFDEYLALSALVEGDAKLWMGAIGEDRRPEEILLEVIRASRLPITELMSDEAIDATFGHRVPYGYHLGFFPYVSGSGFAAEVFRAGGLELLNRAYERPPLSTEQVLHPEKYLRGEAPIYVPVPQTLPAFRQLQANVMGEIGIRAVLNTCYSLEHSTTVATGWGGDSYAVLRGQKQELVLLWNTVWDDDSSAERFARAIQKCFQKRTPSGWAARATLAVASQGSRVAIVRGLKAEQIGEVARGLLEVELKTVELAPLAETSTITFPPLALIEKDRFQDLGLEGSIPPGTRVTPSYLEDQRILVRHEHGSAKLGVLDNPGTRAAWLVKVTLGPTPPPPQHRQEVQLSIGTGKESTFRDGADQVRITLVPICEGRRAYAIVERWADARAEESFDVWKRSLRLITDVSSTPRSDPCPSR